MPNEVNAVPEVHASRPCECGKREHNIADQKRSRNCTSNSPNEMQDSLQTGSVVLSDTQRLVHASSDLLVELGLSDLDDRHGKERKVVAWISTVPNRAQSVDSQEHNHLAIGARNSIGALVCKPFLCLLIPKQNALVNTVGKLESEYINIGNPFPVLLILSITAQERKTNVT